MNTENKESELGVKYYPTLGNPEAQRASIVPVPEMEPKASDCGWRLSYSSEHCVHCSRLTYGRNADCTVAVCFKCYHNITHNCTAARCGEKVFKTHEKES